MSELANQLRLIIMLGPVMPRRPSANLTFEAPAIVIVLAALALAPAQSIAAPTAPEFANEAYQANLTVTSPVDSGDHQLNWTPYDGAFDPFGYDVYYGASPNAPGQNDGRIETGAPAGQWLDIGARLAGRCEPSNYHVVAYSRGRKKYSAPAQGSGINLCNEPDTIAPVVSILQPAEDDQEFQGSVFLSGTAADAGGSGIDSLTVSIDNAETAASSLFTPIVSDGQWLLAVPLDPGLYSASAFATDGAGNPSDAVNINFTVSAAVEDTVSPEITIDSPGVDRTFTSAQQLIEGTVNDFDGSGVSVVTVAISGDANASSTLVVDGNDWSLTTSLPNGAYSVTVNAADRAGNPAVERSVPFSVLQTIDIGADGYDDIEFCDPDSYNTREDRTPGGEPSFKNLFDPGQDIHAQLSQNWKSAYEWRQDTSDVIINNESQFYLDVLGRDADARNTWSPFEQLVDSDGNGYLAINAAKQGVLKGEGPTINGAYLAGQDYVSGVLTTFGIHSLSPSNAGGDGRVVVELKARMPRGQGVFPAAWLYNDSFFRNNPEIDIFEYVGQSPDETGWKKPSAPECGTACVNAGRLTYDTFATQYHNYYMSEKGKLKGLGPTSVDNEGKPTGAVYTNPDSNTWWRGAAWGGCNIDFSAKFHTYTLVWSAEELIWYVDDVEVLRLDEQADSGGNLPRVNFVPIDTRSMYLTLNFALGSVDSYIGAPDGYTQTSMDNNSLRYIIDYIKVWQ